MKKELTQKFLQQFPNEKETDIAIYFAPGRVNLIGEHIDYNGGFVFPAAITFGTYAAVSKRDDNKVALYSGNFPDDGIIEFEQTDLARKQDEPWTVYVKGMMDTFVKRGDIPTKGFNAYIYGNIPNGAGLSSSASLEVLTGVILRDLNNFELDNVCIAKRAQIAENDYVGVNCGIMDQFAIAMGKAEHAIKLNTDTLDYEYAPCDLGSYKILIMNTNKRRELADSKYNERRGECESALEILKNHADISHLCDLSEKDFSVLATHLPDETLLKRARHCITEQARVKSAVSALASGDLVQFGQLLNGSHASLKDDYEVTGIELDTIVALAQAQDGVLGARMTGAGFGGCAIALVHEDQLEAVQEVVGAKYEEIIGYAPAFYVASIGGGARKL